MKKFLSIILSTITVISALFIAGCFPTNSGPVYSDTFVSNATHHWRPLIDGSDSDPLYVDYGAHVNKKGRCECGHYFECTALVYGLNGAGTGLICYGGADPFNPAIDANNEFSVSDPEYGGWLHVEVPAEAVYEGRTYPVLELADSAFKYDQIESIKLNEGLKKIGSQAFGYLNKLKEVVIPNSVEHTYNGGSFFYFSTGIEKVVIGNGIKNIPNYCFYNCKNLKTVILGNSVQRLGFSSFFFCEKLSYIVLPASLSTVDTNAAANGIANNDVYYPFTGCATNFKMYFLGNTIPDGTHPLNPNWTLGANTYMPGQWGYDENGIPYAL